MEIQNLRLQLLSMANGNVDQAKDMECYVFSQDSREDSCAGKTMGSDICSGGSLGRLPEVEDPSVAPSLHWSAAVDSCVQTPKGIRVQCQGSASTYRLPDELLKSVDDFLYSLERSLKKQ